MNAPHKDRAHAALGGSGTGIWMNCPASIRLGRGIEKASSSFAAEGTVYHELVETCLRTNTDPADYVGEINEADGHKIRVDEDMADHADAARRFYRSLVEDDMDDWEVFYEQRVDLSHLHPAMFGTADYVAYNPKTKHLRVADLKYGRGVAVEPQDNKQGLFYALGAVFRYHNQGLDKVTISIFQPRAPHPKGPARHWETDAISLLEFKEDLIDAAKATEDPAAVATAGDWCRFCAAAAICPALKERAMKTAQAEFASDPEYDPAALAAALASADIVEAWLHRTREFAHAEAIAGRMPPGWKLVAKRATRKWQDDDAAKKTLTLVVGVEDEDLFEEPKFNSPAKMEKVLKAKYGFKGKAAGAEIEGLVSKVSSGVVLAQEDDPRPAVRPDAAAEFDAVEVE